MKSHEVKITRQNLLDAREEYLKHNTTPPKQLNAKFSEKNGWTLEFHEDESCYSEGFSTCLTSEWGICYLLFSCDEDDECIVSLQQGWNDNFNDDKQ